MTTTEATHYQRRPLAERVASTRAHVPEEHRQHFEDALREATEQALASGDYTALDNVAEQWWRAAFIEDKGGEAWQRIKWLILEGRWDELMTASDLRPGDPQP